MPYINDNHYSAKGLSINRTSKAMKENSIKSSTNPSKLKDIMKKIHNYRLSLNQELLKILTEEREKEKKREIIVGNCAKEDDKLRLEKLFAIERAVASNKIINFNKYIVNINSREIEYNLAEFEKKINTDYKP